MYRLIRILAIALAAPWVLGILVDGADRERYERSPPEDPGWKNVGRRGSTSAVYLGSGWILTARHSGIGPVHFDGEKHRPVADSMVWLDDPGGSKADLILFRVEPEPELPALRLRHGTPSAGARAMLVGYGSGRGRALEWSGFQGFRFTPAGRRRWGLNTVNPGRVDVPGPNKTRTHCFQLDFTANGVDEAAAGAGDSGGAVFVRGPREWYLAGVMISVARLPGQAGDLALYGNVTNVADLSLYTPQIIDVTRGEPDSP
jgi:hypothetical protein